MAAKSDGPLKSALYHEILDGVFFSKFRPGDEEVPFKREDLLVAAKERSLPHPKNLGDVIYSARYRSGLPSSIRNTEPGGKEWVIEGRGKALYRFVLASIARIRPSDHLLTVKVPDATPEIVARYALSDEQALLAKVRYNRLLDIFLGVTTYSLQNHLRTTVKGLGQLEIDEIYVGVDKRGAQFVIPVQAKGGKDELSSIQSKQDMECCAEKFPELVCRAVSAQFTSRGRIALFELTLDQGEVKVVEERHYRLVPADRITADDLRRYSR